MITFKEYIAEGYLADLLTKLGEVKKEIAEDLGQRRYKVMVNRAVNDGRDGTRIAIAVPISDGHLDAQEFFEKMVVKTAEKSLRKHFDKHTVAAIDNIKWEDGRAVYLVIVVPDADGMI
jgi:hypothetical protein